MGWQDWLLLAGLAAVIGGVVFFLLRRKGRGCGGHCDSCPYNGKCKPK